MKTIRITLILLVLTLKSFGQLQTSKLRLYEMDLGAGFYKVTNSGGISFTQNILLASNNNLLGSNMKYGTDNIDHKNGRFTEIYELNLVFGRKIIMNKKFNIEPLFGFGLYSQKSTFEDVKNRETIGVPVMVNFKFLVADTIWLGINCNYNINGVNNNGGVCLIASFVI